jgi:ribosomal protein L7/L12
VHDAYRLSDSAETRGIAVPRILRMIRIVKSLAASIPCETVEQLQQLLKTGIADDIKPVDEELLDQRALSRGLLEELADDEELSGFARLTKQLIAAITLPRTLSDPDDLQMGGISDITNRGSLDKLLLSELAHDDLTLAVRLAMNEALYMRRESPPVPQARTRSVLIDVSLPMWGIPRLFATAAALALHATSDRQIRINCLRSSMVGMKPSKLITREGLQEHLAALEPTAHPGSSLAAFFQALGEESQAAEPVLITTSDVLENAEFRQTLDKLCSGDLWLVVVERDGRLKVLQKTRQGTSVRKQMQLPLEEILSRRTAEKIVRKDLPEELPAIFHLARFPLLLSHQTRVGRLWRWGETAIAVTDDGRLMHWTKKGFGALQLATGLAARSDARIFLLKQSPGAFCQLLICPPGGRFGSLITVSASAIDGIVSIAQADYQISDVSDVVSTETALLVFGKLPDGTEVCSAVMHDTGTFLGTYSLGSRVEKRIGRCLLLSSKGYCVLSWVGGQTSWLLQLLPEPYKSRIEGAEERFSVAEISSGNFLLIHEGRLIDPRNAQRFEQLNTILRGSYSASLKAITELSLIHDLLVASHLKVVGTGRSRGLSDSFRTAPLMTDSGHTVIDLRSGEVIVHANCEPAGSETNHIARIEYERAFKSVRQHTPHYRFTQIGVDAGHLLLKDPGGGLFRIDWDSQNSVIRLDRAGTIATLSQSVEFVETPVDFNQKRASSIQPVGRIPEAVTFSVKLTSTGENVIAVIKAIRAVPGKGLKEAKDAAQCVPSVISSGLSRESANVLTAEIITAGGTCEIISSVESEKIADGSGFTLQKAQWDNGSKAWLDSRGLLHLKSANRANLEITLVMRDGPLSGWLSSGEVFGDTYYYGDDLTAQGLRRVTANVAWKLAIRPFIESLPWNFNFSSDTAQVARIV